MPLEFIDQEPDLTEKPKAIVINGVTVGEAKPCTNCGGDTRWHVAICLHDRRFIGSELIQGFGNSIPEAIDDAVATANSRRDALAQRLAEFEASLKEARADVEPAAAV